MDFWRALGKLSGGLVFTTCLVLAILFMQLIEFTSYENVLLVAGGIVEGQLDSLTDGQMQQLRLAMEIQCNDKETVAFPIYEGFDAVLNCTQVAGSTEEQFKKVVVKSVVDGIYYKEFDCDIYECITSGNQLDVIASFSEQGNKFYSTWHIYIWIGAAAGLAVMLASTKTWVGRLKAVGFTLAVTGLPFLFVNQIKSMLPPLPVQVQGTIVPIIDGLISSLSNKFIIVFAIGAVLLVAGYGLQFYLKRTYKESKKK